MSEVLNRVTKLWALPKKYLSSEFVFTGFGVSDSDISLLLNSLIRIQRRHLQKGRESGLDLIHSYLSPDELLKTVCSSYCELMKGGKYTAFTASFLRSNPTLIPTCHPTPVQLLKIFQRHLALPDMDLIKHLCTLWRPPPPLGVPVKCWWLVRYTVLSPLS